ncbi:MAG: efflux RND transporter periplasmic adaptor subunit [Terracidiphilus sp.]
MILAGLAATGCQKKPVAAAGGGMQALPVQTVSVAMAPVPQSSEYVATIKSRRSATLMPQVSGVLTEIRVKSGDVVKVGQELMVIDPRQQQAAVNSQRATEQQKKAVYDYNAIELDRQKKLFEAGVTSRDAYDQEQQAYQNSKADYESAVESRKTQEQLLGYYTICAPFDGVVGDIPVHVGDYVSPLASPATILTTVDENKNLEAYIYVPTELSAKVKMGLGVDLLDNNGSLLEKTRIDFISPQVDSDLQGILVKAPVNSKPGLLRTAQLIKARIVWSTASTAVVPVLAVTRLGGQTFVYVAEDQGGKYTARQTSITVGDTVGNDYAVESGLKNGDKVIVSGLQFLMDGMPVMPLPPAPPGQGGAQGAPGAGI